MDIPRIQVDTDCVATNRDIRRVELSLSSPLSPSYTLDVCRTASIEIRTLTQLTLAILLHRVNFFRDSLLKKSNCNLKENCKKFPVKFTEKRGFFVLMKTKPPGRGSGSGTALLKAKFCLPQCTVDGTHVGVVDFSKYLPAIPIGTSILFEEILS